MPHLTEEIETRISRSSLFLLDLDGTIYRGNELIAGARAFIGQLAARRIPYVFLTNNSSKRAIDFLKTLQGLGIEASIDNVFTSGQATGLYLSRQKPMARICLVGTAALARELAAYGISTAEDDGPVDFVVVGFDSELTYSKLLKACSHIDRGVEYVATNPDYVCPIQGGRSIPDCGSICFMIEQATGKKPLVIGKPSPEMVHLLCRKFQVTPERTTIIGDRLYTDIALGRNAGAFTICVMTGESSLADIEQSPVKPDLTIGSIDELNRLFRRAP